MRIYGNKTTSFGFLSVGAYDIIIIAMSVKYKPHIFTLLLYVQDKYIIITLQQYIYIPTEACRTNDRVCANDESTDCGVSVLRPFVVYVCPSCCIVFLIFLFFNRTIAVRQRTGVDGAMVESQKLTTILNDVHGKTVSE